MLLAVWLGCLTPSTATGGLRFESRRLEFKVAPAQERVEASFPFINEGDQPARIESVLSDCACLKAQAPEGEIPPGGRGVVSAEFRAGSLRGIVEKHLSVKVQQGGKSRRLLLDAVLVVPELVKLEPRTLSWTAGEDGREKSFRVRMTGDEAVRLIEVRSPNPQFAFRVETLSAGREYLVHAKPLSIAGPTLALVNFKTDCRYEKFRTPVGFVHIRRP